MRVHELIDILSDQPADAEVSPRRHRTGRGGFRRHHRRSLLRRRRASVEDDEDDEDSDGELTIWLVGGEEADVNAFLDAIEQPDA